MPSTSEQFAVRDVFDPKQNVDAGARFLKQLFDKYKGNLGMALAAYNAGPAAVDERKASRTLRKHVATWIRSSKFCQEGGRRRDGLI